MVVSVFFFFFFFFFWSKTKGEEFVGVVKSIFCVVKSKFINCCKIRVFAISHFLIFSFSHFLIFSFSHFLFCFLFLFSLLIFSFLHTHKNNN